MSCYYFEVLLKVYFQDTSKRYQPLFENKAILWIVIYIKAFE